MSRRFPWYAHAWLLLADAVAVATVVAVAAATGLGWFSAVFAIVVTLGAIRLGRRLARRGNRPW